MIDSYVVTCPYCGFTGGERTDFGISCADECCCPRCGEWFILEFDTDDEEDEDTEETE